MAPKDYKVGWICALPTETAAAICMLDTVQKKISQPKHDSNSYTLGSIGCHNIVITCLPAGVVGQISTSRVASQLKSTFSAIRFVLMVGIGGGVPSRRHDIRLGDVVVSKPDADSGGVIQFDYGKTISEGRFVRTGSLNRPPDILLNAVANLQAQHMLHGSQIQSILHQTANRYHRRAEACKGLCSDCDQLFEWSYDHQNLDSDCFDCDRDRIVERTPRYPNGPLIHYGLIASGNQVMRHGGSREILRKDLDVLCFEMEAAALMDNFHCLVIRGICDYADSHKNKEWQDYAALTAAAYAKELLNIIPAEEVLASNFVVRDQVEQPEMEAQQIPDFALTALPSNPWDVLSLAACITQHIDFMTRMIVGAVQSWSDNNVFDRVEAEIFRGAFYLGDKIEYLSWSSTILRHKKLVVPENNLPPAAVVVQPPCPSEQRAY
jgi:nucleoside phosphorylase